MSFCWNAQRYAPNRALRDDSASKFIIIFGRVAGRYRPASKAALEARCVAGTWPQLPGGAKSLENLPCPDALEAPNPGDNRAILRVNSQMPVKKTGWR